MQSKCFTIHIFYFFFLMSDTLTSHRDSCRLTIPPSLIKSGLGLTPYEDALCNGINPPLSCAFTSAPFSNRCSATSKWLYPAVDHKITMRLFSDESVHTTYISSYLKTVIDILSMRSDVSLSACGGISGNCRSHLTLSHKQMPVIGCTWSNPGSLCPQWFSCTPKLRRDSHFCMGS